MDSFELNKIMGAVLGTCLVLLATNMAANAIFAPKKLEKPGFEIAVKETDGAAGAAAAAAPSEPIENCSRPLPSRRALPPPRSARPAIPSKRTARTRSARTSTAFSTTRLAMAVAASTSRLP